MSRVVKREVTKQRVAKQRITKQAARGSAIRETFTGLLSWRVITVPIVVIVSVLIGVYVAFTASSVSASQLEALEKDLSGRYVLKLTDSQGPIEAQVCERLRNFGGVVTAFAISDEHRPYSLGNKVRVPLAEVSPGFIDYVAADSQLGAAAASSMLVGADIAERAGLVTGARIVLNDEYSSSQGAGFSSGQHNVSVVDRTARTGLSDDLVAMVNSANFLARECIIEVRPYAIDDVSIGAGALVPGATAAVSAFDPVLEGDSSPERAIKVLIGGPVVWMAAVLLLLMPLALWYVRRAEWALFFAFGVNMRWQAMAVAGEWILLIGIPALVGAAWALILLPATVTWLGYLIALLNLAAILLLAVLSVPLWLIYLRFSSVLQSLKD